MLKRISTIDYYGTEFIDLENNRILLDEEKFEKVKKVLNYIIYYFGSDSIVIFPEDEEDEADSFIINLYIDEYQFELYAEKVGDIMKNTAQNIYKDGELVVENGHTKKYENFDIILDFHTKLNLLIRNMFCYGNIENTLYTIKNKYDTEYLTILNQLIPIFFDNIDFIDSSWVYTKLGYKLQLESQGSGFISFVNLIPSLCDAIKNNSTVIIDAYTSFHPILSKAIFKELWDEGYLHKLLKEDSSKGQIIMREICEIN